MHKSVIEHTQRQIRELYGPLYCLLRRGKHLHGVFTTIVGTNKAEWKRLRGPDGIFRPDKLKLKRNKDLWVFFTDTYFIPSNSRIRQLIELNYNLLYSYELPQSFENFFNHEAQYQSMRNLEKRVGMVIPNKHLEEHPWPEGFNNDVEETLLKLKESVLRATGVPSFSRGRSK